MVLICIFWRLIIKNMDIDKQKDLEIKEFRILALKLAKLLLEKISDPSISKEKRENYKKELLALKPKLEMIIKGIEKL